ncbi:MAG: hypothetical protein U5K71_02115 [Gracilimonas sp.]|nr:hypothetical protein [Gracilimonas sp.]
MLNKIKKALKNVSIWKPSFDPSKFNDDIAMKTEWYPLKRGGSNFGTHKLVKVDYNRIEFKSTLGAKLFSLIFLAVGVGIPVFLGVEKYRSYGSFFRSDFLFIVLFGLIFFAAGSWMYYSFSKPVIFDKTKGMFWKGWKAPKRYLSDGNKKSSSRISHIYALQIIPELVRSDNNNYVSYELNLVLRDGSRMNVVDHGNLGKIRSDSKTLSEFLGVSIWEAN